MKQLRLVGVLTAFTLALVAASDLGARGQQPAAPPEQPRFRAGTNLVRLDVYVSKDGTSVDDLAQNDFEVLEDGKPQTIETFELIRPKTGMPTVTRRDPSSISEMRDMAAEADTRVFVLFFDEFHVSLSGSFRTAQPVANLLNRVIGPDDLVGAMTTSMIPRDITYTRRTRGVEEMLRENWHWGQADSKIRRDPAEQDIESCFPPMMPQYADIARKMIERRRVRRTIDSLAALIPHLEGLREERKFVFFFSEGFVPSKPDPSLSRALEGRAPGIPPISVGPTGQLTTSDPRQGDDRNSCEQQRARLAAEDLESDFMQLLQRANRANVSFYPVEARGMVVFDDNASAYARDDRLMFDKHTTLRTLAETTGGAAVINTNNISGALERIVADIGSYYLLGYYSTNAKMDGRFRKLTVRVKRPGVQVRARPGYLAPTESEIRTATTAAAVPAMPAGIERALQRLGAAGGANLPVRAHAASQGGRITVVTELDAATIKSAEWKSGGRVEVIVQHESGGGAEPIRTEGALAAGERSVTVVAPPGPELKPGRYVVRVSVMPQGSTIPTQATTDVEVAAPGGGGMPGPMVLRRGPATGLQYFATADPRFRRTERLRLEWPREASGTVTARLLARDAKPLPIAVAISERAATGESPAMTVADLTLAPLAPGEYVVEIALESGGKAETIAYAFRIVP